jgi:L-amino acid N-acyltransferase YncA
MAKSNSNSGGRYPRQIKLADGRQISMRLMRPQDADEIVRFARTLPEEDLLFLRSDITDPAIVADWARNLERGATVTILAEIDEKLAGYASIHLSETRWTRGVGEIRVNVGPSFRGLSLGKRLTAEIFDVARSLNLRKITAMMTSDQPVARAVFERLGFRVEALLSDWVEDRHGQPRDLLVMSHDVHGLTDQVEA